MSFGLINYWPMDNNATDKIGNANMYNGYNVQFVDDRFGKPNSAIRFSDGYYQVPSGVYFNGDYTIAVWVKINVQIPSSRIIDFNNGCYMDNTILATSNMGNSQPYLQQFISTFESKLASNLALITGQWTHLVVTLNEMTGSIYINGLLTSQVFNIYTPKYVNRTSNFIGKSCSADDGNLQADLDDLRIYNRALSQSEIYDLIRLTSGYTPYITTTTTTTTTTKTSTTTKTTTTSKPTTKILTTNPITTTTSKPTTAPITTSKSTTRKQA